MKIPSTSPDVTAWAIGLLDTALDPDEAFSLKPDRTGAYRLLVVRADLQNRVTPISRYCRVGIQAWCVDSSGRPDAGASFDLAAAAGRVFEAAPRTGILLDAEVDSGPMRVVDPTSRIEYHYVTVLLEVNV